MNAWAIVVAGIGGAVAGGLLTGGFAWLVEKEHWARSEQTRWLDDRRQLYARFLQATDEVLQATTLHDIAVGGGDVESLAEAGRRLGAADEAVRRGVAEIELVGGDDEVEAAQRMRQAVWSLSGANSLRPTNELSAHERQRRLDAAIREWDEAQKAFKAAARRSLQPAG